MGSALFYRTSLGRLSTATGGDKDILVGIAWVKRSIFAEPKPKGTTGAEFSSPLLHV